MARKCVRYKSVYSPSTGGYVRKCAEYSGTGSLAGLGSFGQAQTLRGSIDSVKDVLVTGSIAAGGAIVTEKVFATIAGKLALEGYKEEVAKMATGIALGILIGKFLKKPRIAAAFAIGPIVAGAINIIHDLLGEPNTMPDTAGYGMVSIEPYKEYAYSGANQPALNAPANVGEVKIGPDVPAWMYGRPATNGAYPFPAN